MLRKIQVCLLEGQAQARDKIQGRLHRGDRAPEIAAHRQFAEPDATLLHAPQVKARVILLVPERLEHAPPERGGRIGKFQEHQRHQLGGEQLVIGEEVEQPPTLRFLLKLMQAGEFLLARAC